MRSGGDPGIARSPTAAAGRSSRARHLRTRAPARSRRSRRRRRCRDRGARPCTGSQSTMIGGATCGRGSTSQFAAAATPEIRMLPAGAGRTCEISTRSRASRRPGWRPRPDRSLPGSARRILPATARRSRARRSRRTAPSAPLLQLSRDAHAQHGSGPSSLGAPRWRGASTHRHRAASGSRDRRPCDSARRRSRRFEGQLPPATPIAGAAAIRTNAASPPSHEERGAKHGSHSSGRAAYALQLIAGWPAQGHFAMRSRRAMRRPRAAAGGFHYCTRMDLVRSERRGAVALLTLNRPQALNALDAATLEALEARIAEVARDAGVRALVLTGEGRAFAAGADIAAMRPFGAAEAGEFSRLGHARVRGARGARGADDRGGERLCARRRLRARARVRLDLRVGEGALRPARGESRHRCPASAARAGWCAAWASRGRRRSC